MALAEEQVASPVEAAADQAHVEEIVVTANRRSESLQKVPISVNAISAATAAARGVTDLQSIATAVPGLTTSRSATSNSPYIRGVGNPAPDIANEPSVATYVDNVYVANGGATLFDLNNIERVEVLKGPQGTLFGRNATGGVIHIITKDPTQATVLDASAGYANYNTYSGKLYASTGLTDTLAMNIALSGQDRKDGWGKNINTGHDTAQPWNYIGRAKLLWTPGADTRILLTGAYNKENGNSGYDRTPIAGTVVANPPGTPTGNVGFYNTNLTINPAQQQHTTTFSGKIDQDFDFATLTSITAWSKYKQHVRYDLDVSPQPSQITELFGANRATTEELQLKSPTANARFNWIVGLFYLDGFAAYDPQLVYIGSTQTRANIAKIDSSSIAGYAQGTYEIFEGTHLTAGIRYTRDHRHVDGRTLINNVLQAATVTDASKSWKKLTYRIALDHQFTQNAMVYASLNTGFKSGVYNPTSFTAPPANPETLTAYEIGFKTQWLDNRLRLNGAAYLYDYKNMQVTVIITPAGSTIPTSFTQNAAKARVKGFELDATAVPTDRITLTAGLSVMDAHYRSYLNGNHFTPNPAPAGTAGCPLRPYPANATGGQTSVAGCDLSGNDMIQAPKFTFNGTFNYKLPTSVGDFNFNATYFHTAHWYFEPDNSVGNKAYDLVNLSLNWTAPNKRWGLTGWTRNLNGAKYYLSGASTSAAKYYAAAEPRVYGVTVNLHLD